MKILLRDSLARFTIYYTFFLDLMGYAVVLPVFAPLLFNNTTDWLTTYSYTLRCLLFAALLFIYAAAHGLGEPFFAKLAIAKGKKPVLILTTSISILAYAIMAFAFIHQSLTLLFIGRFLGGFAAGNCNFVAELSQKLILPQTNKIFALNWPSIAGGIGLICGPLTIGILVDEQIQTWFFNALPFWIMAVLAFVNVLLLSLIQENEIGKQEHSYLNPRENISSFLTFVKNPLVHNAGLSCFFFFLGWFSLLQFSSAYMFLKFNFSESALGFAFAILGVAWCIALFFTNKKFSLKVLLLLAGLFSFMVPFAHSLYLLFILLAIIVALCAIIWTNLGLFFKPNINAASAEENTIVFIYISCALAALLATIICGILLIAHYALIYVASSVCFFLSAGFLFNSRRYA